MGAAPDAAAPENTPLLATGVAVTMPAAPVKEPRMWRGHWAQVLGPCNESTPADVAACCLAWHAPFIAFGWNSNRALGLHWVKEALKFFVLTVGLLLLGRAVCSAVMMAGCPHPPPPPHMGPNGMVLARGGAIMASSSDSSSVTVASVTLLPAKVEDDDDDDMEAHFHGAWFQADHPPADPLSPEMQQCMAVMLPVAITCGLITIAGLAAVIIMASRRRTAIRERFGIPGTPMNDCCLWTFCSPCALAQETRTLMHNNVESESWLGPHCAPTPITV